MGDWGYRGEVWGLRGSVKYQKNRKRLDAGKTWDN